MKSSLVFCAAAIVLGSTSSCSTAGKTVYEPSQTGVIMKEKTGQVISVRDVIIKPTDNGGIFSRGNPGANIGGTVGRAAATGESVGVAAAGIVGEEAGRAIGGQFDQKPGEEISIKLDEGDEMITIVQERSNPPLAAGERIKVLVPSRTSAGSAISAISILRGGSPGGGVRVVRDPDRFAATPGSNFLRETQVAQSR